MTPEGASRPVDSGQSMQQAQELADTLEENLQDYSWGAAYLRPELVEIFSKLVKTPPSTA